MHLVEIDIICIQAAQTPLDSLKNMLARPALLIGTLSHLPKKLCRQHNLFAPAFEPAPNIFLMSLSPGISRRHAVLYGPCALFSSRIFSSQYLYWAIFRVVTRPCSRGGRWSARQYPSQQNSFKDKRLRSNHRGRCGSWLPGGSNN